MKKKNQDVRFIRKNGRIIPIRVKGGAKPKKRKTFTRSERTQKVKNSGFKIFAGALSASLGGSIFGVFSGEVAARKKTMKTLREQIRAHKKAAMMGSSLNKQFATNLSKVAQSRTKQINRLDKFGKRAGISGSVLGGVLLGKAVTEGFEGLTGRDLTASQEVLTEVGGAASLTIIANRISKARKKPFKQGLKIASKLVFKR